ncbi:MAG TPA: DUF3679 domain-containing protein [Bacillales bacterium]|nr:DUF3679 domain-containing protein [Bacillales bacterium]
MVKFTIKCMLVASLFFFGVLVGMQKAQEGIQDMQQGGAHLKVEQSAQQPGKKSPLAEQKAALKDIQSFNVFSAAGDAASDFVTGLFRSGVNAASSLILKWLST